jgi:RNA polymerase sigma factor (TIGR02999 family)
MAKADSEHITQLVTQISQTRAADAVGELMPVVYEELRALARRYFRDERPDHTLQPTALVHEAYLRLVDQTRVDWQGQAHFRAIAARAMRRVLIDHARRKKRVKRGGGQEAVALDSQLVPADLNTTDVTAVNDAIEALAQLDARQARIVEMRFFGGLGMEEIAVVIGVSKRTIEGEWTHAKAWLRKHLDLEAHS